MRARLTPTPSPQPTADAHVLEKLLAEGPGVAAAVRELLGHGWWEATVPHVATSPAHQRRMWNALGWIAWERSLADLRARLEGNSAAVAAGP